MDCRGFAGLDDRQAKKFPADSLAKDSRHAAGPSPSQLRVFATVACSMRSFGSTFGRRVPASRLRSQADPKTGKRRNLGTFKSRAAAEKHEGDVRYFKRH